MPAEKGRAAPPGGAVMNLRKLRSSRDRTRER